ncbi:MAG: TIGR02530 family flagellar biosynthesis protein [Chloroherpetonaceae bacterium]|nr:hypothetical protein [Chthonomonadaceae bacterium]MDW8209193.1 TIGR02530 family flagellar biosynthesis protein [Chloroherpetonaceae bacterium]
MADTLRIYHIPEVPRPSEPSAHSASTQEASPSFAEILRARQGLAETGQTPGAGRSTPVRFSAHAQTRLQSRQIHLQESHLQRLNGAVAKAADKGSRDALILMDDLAMVVSIKNRTVVTVVDKEHLRQNVFTNIDSAVIA